MKRLFVVFVAVVSLITSVRAGTPLSAQGVPSAGAIQEFVVEGGRVLGLSPDGTKYAIFIPGSALCVFDATTLEQIACASFEEMPIRPRIEDMVWSPDSTRIAFGEQAFSYGDDGDLWVVDAATGELTNLTDDGYAGSLVMGDDLADATFSVDVAPAWTPDSQFITYSRSTWVEGERRGNDLAQIAATGGEADTLTTVSVDTPGVVYYGTGWSPDGETFYYSVNDFRAEDPENGIWAYDLKTGETTLFAAADEDDLGPLALLRISPAGDTMLGWYPEAFGQFAVSEPLLRLIDAPTGAISPVELPGDLGDGLPGLVTASFSPDGTALLLLTPSEEAWQLWVTDLVTGEHTLIVEELEDAIIEPFLTPTWGANGNAMVGRGTGAGYLIPIAGIGLSGHPATGTVSSQGVPAGGPVRSVELPEGRAISMSPDGRYLAATVPPQESLCIYEVATMAEVSCADLAVLNTGLRVGDVVWSPDSTRLAFSEQTFVTLKDGDLWVMDAQSGELTNLTDDGYTGPTLSLQSDDGEPYFIDVAPAWTPDSQFITFSRTISDGVGLERNVIAQLPADGGEVATLADISTAPGAWYFRGQWSPDGEALFFSFNDGVLENGDNGIWRYDAATGEAGVLAVSDDPEMGPLTLMQVSPAGDRLLAYYPIALMQGGYLGKSPLRFVDPMTGALSPVPDPAPESEIFEGTWIATFSPDGQYLLQAVGMDASARSFWVTDLSTGLATEVEPAIEGAVPIEFGLGPVWGSDGTVFVAWNVTGAHFFPIEGAGTGPVAATGSANPIGAPDALTPGDTAVTNGMTPLFAAPDANATVVYILVPNSTVQILGAPVVNEQGTWYPVLDPASQIIGYAQASRLEHMP